MTTSVGKRARTDDAKGLRRKALLTCARQMLQTAGSNSLTMSALADKAGLAKGTVYLYFPTREAVFLAVLTEDLDTFFGQVVVGLQNLKSQDMPLGAAHAISNALSNCRTLLPLLQVLHTQLERNVPFAELAEFKAYLLGQVQRAGTVLEAAVRLQNGKGITVFLRGHALAVGMSQMADRSETLQAVYQRHPELSPLAIDFKTEFAAALADQIRAFGRTTRRSQ